MWDSNSINYQGKLCNHVKLYYKHLCCLINISIPQLKFVGFFLLALYFSISIYVFISVFPFSQLCIQANYKAIDHGRRVSYNFLPVFASSLCKKYFPLPQCLPHKLLKKAWITYAYLFQNVPIDVVQGTLTPPKRFGVHWFSSNEMC